MEKSVLTMGIGPWEVVEGVIGAAGVVGTAGIVGAAGVEGCRRGERHLAQGRVLLPAGRSG